jgi:hypothetical protein
VESLYYTMILITSRMETGNKEEKTSTQLGTLKRESHEKLIHLDLLMGESLEIV